MAKNPRIRILKTGKTLIQCFLVIMLILLGAGVPLGIFIFSASLGVFLLCAVIVILVECFLFWAGIIMIYTTSIQLGMKWRIIGIICGWIPILHLIALGKILKIVSDEIEVENEKEELNAVRAENAECKTRYPILMVHGVFFRDTRFFNYWGRVPKELMRNGATIFYGNQQSAASVADSGKELAQRILQIVHETGCEKVNVIAHSKGGLDTRYAISCCKISSYVASLTTINTPHRGCIFADYLLEKLPKKVQDKVADQYNRTLKKLGDSNPDFISAVTDITASKCRQFNEQMPDQNEVFYQSYMSKMNRASSGKFPLNVAYPMVKHFDGDNDGLVAVNSAPWGEDFTLITVPGKRGISHGDMIDLNRENIPGFDIREFYVSVVQNLKQRGF